MRCNEDRRKELAKAFGLPETATIAELTTAANEECRKRRAIELGLPETAPWTEIRACTDLLREALRPIFHLGVDGPDSWIDVAIWERCREEDKRQENRRRQRRAQ